MAEKETEFLPYKVICKPGTGIYEEKKSRFIAYVAPASSEEEAVSFIDSIKKKEVIQFKINTQESQNRL